MSNHTALSPADDYSGPKRSLVIAGGGMRVAYQAGVIRALAEAGLCFHHADGTSGGTINLAMLMSGLSPNALCRRWQSVNVRDFVSFVPPHEYLQAHDMLAMGDADGIINKIFPHLGIDLDKINRAQGVAGTFNVCNYTRKTNEVVNHQQLTLDLLVAGISLPIFMPPVVIDQQIYTDSVWIKDANLMEAVKRGADEIWLIWCIANTGHYATGAFAQYVHMIELSANGALFEEFDRIKEINARIVAGDSPYGQQQPIRLHVLKPKHPLPLDPDLYLGRIDSATLISMGYADTKNYLSTLDPLGLPFEPEVTQMQETTTLGVHFRETMAGGFVLDETDPTLGAQKGKAQGCELAMHATIDIHDIQGFVTDPNHLGRIHGTLDFTPFGEGIPASHGAFNLFSPTDDPAMKLMIYELGFTHEGQDYYLAGKKTVKDDPGFDLWTDTTTLYTTLHKGRDAGGPVVGAGVLSLGIKELMKLVSTLRATNADNMGEKMQAFATFGKFFMGELWDSYAKFVNKH